MLDGVANELDTTHAACKGLAVDPVTERDSFFPERGTAQITARDAKRICNGFDGVPECPIREACLEYALQRKERFGIWGGLSERERARVLKKRRVEQRRRELEAEQQVQLEEQRRQAQLEAHRARRQKRQTPAVHKEHAAKPAAPRFKETCVEGQIVRRRIVDAA